MKEFISINDGMPPENTWVLVVRCIDGVFYMPDTVTYVNDGYFKDEIIDEEHDIHAEKNSNAITHWCLLPKQPTA